MSDAYDPDTQCGICLYNDKGETTVVGPTDTIDSFFFPPKGKTFLDGMNQKRDSELIIKLYFPQIDAIADLKQRSPADFNPESTNDMKYQIFRDPRKTNMADVWNDVHVFRTIYQFMTKPAKLKGKLIAVYAGSNVATCDFIFDISTPEAFAELTAVVEAWEGVDMGNAYMDDPGMTDAALIKEITALIAKRGEDPLRVVISSEDWTIQRHPDTGAILHREIAVQYAIKNSKGKHQVDMASFKQDYAGGSWGKTKLLSFSLRPPFSIAKVNIDKARPKKG